ncbi:MAG: response regulator [Elusimicrobia bacterium]|nr:response regulator [Elusimicrobiota bacterium]
MARVLVVDDDVGIVEFISQCLRSQQHEVFIAFNGKRGCDLAGETKPDIIILDLMMPDMHGFEVCQRIREDGRLKGVKIIISSGKSFGVDKKAAMRLGADAYLTKPYSLEALLEAVKEALGGGSGASLDVSNLPNGAGSIRPNLRRSEGLDGDK